MSSLENLSLNLERSKMKNYTYNEFEEGLSNLVNLTSLNLIMRDGEIIIVDGEGIVVGSKIVDLSNL